MPKRKEQMSQVLRPLAASGVVLTTAGMIAVTPVAVTQVPDIQSRLVTLTAGGVSDLPSGFGDLFSNTQTNATDLFNHFSFAPFPALQQAIANQIGNIEGVFSDPSTIANIPGDIASNAEAEFKAPFGPFIPVAGSSSDVYSSLDPREHLLSPSPSRTSSIRANQSRTPSTRRFPVTSNCSTC
jgi:hypothetical protein